MKNQEKTQEVILAPMTGTAVAITDVPDPIFTEKILGDGIAIIPTDGKIVSPVDGVVSKVVETGHIYEITSESGVIILIHMGLETVALNGKCFHIYAKIGDKVKAGDYIGKVGCTGEAYGSHLHYDVKKSLNSSDYTQPLDFFKNINFTYSY
jgi:PTS system glucose-specific IIA component